MTVPLITGPHDYRGKAKFFPSPPPGSLLVAEHKRGGYEAVLPGERVGTWMARGLRRYYVVRRRSGLTTDEHVALGNDIMMQFRINYSFYIELLEPLTEAEGRNDDALREYAILAVRYYSEHADPVPLFRTRLRQRFTWLARRFSTPTTGRLYDAMQTIAVGDDPEPEIASPGSPDDFDRRIIPSMSQHGMRVRLEQYIASPSPRSFNDATVA
ncbi:MAG: hypothetical protein KDB24_06590 [Microthrixaceae bacterium]|nr:hypothetical protein [Microthrixaceae bacterium]